MEHLLGARPIIQVSRVIPSILMMNRRLRGVKQVVSNLTRTQTPDLTSETPLTILLNLPWAPLAIPQSILPKSAVAKGVGEGLAASCSAMRRRRTVIILPSPASKPLGAYQTEIRRDGSELKSQGPRSWAVCHWSTALRKGWPGTPSQLFLTS